MKYVISSRERPAASFSDYEAAQERVLKIFDKDWKMPASFTVHQFVVRVGDYGGYMIIETDNPIDIHYFTSVFCGLPIQGRAGRRCDGCGRGGASSHRIQQEESSLNRAEAIPPAA